MPLKRKCGDCTACCTVLTIEPLSKPAGTTCGSCTGTGCGIYETRPEVCQKFECHWLEEKLPHHSRPDKIGIMFCYTRWRYGIIVAAFEIVEGAADTPEARYYIDRLDECLIVQADGNRRYVGKPGVAAEIARRIQKL